MYHEREKCMRYILSIILCIYNVEDYIEKCLSSLEKQNFPNEVEILLIDDGSTDSSGVICDKISSKTAMFKTIHKKNGGVASARNFGLQKAQGEYIAWVDPDDYISDNWWKIIQPIIYQSPEMIYFDISLLKNGKIENTHFDVASRVLKREELINNLANDIIRSHVWSKILQKKCYTSKIFNEKCHIFEDYQMMHQITYNVNKCEYIHSCIYIYRQREGSLLHDNNKILLNSMLIFKFTQERLNFYKARGIDFGFTMDILDKALKFCTKYAYIGGGEQFSRNKKIL